MPQFVAACGFANAKARRLRGRRFSRRRRRRRGEAQGHVLVASGDRDTFQLASDKTTILYPVRAGEMARIGPAEVRAALRRRAGAGARLHRAARRSVRQAAGRARPRRAGRGEPVAANTGRWRRRSRPGDIPEHADRLRMFRSIATMNRKAPLPRCATRRRLGESRRAGEDVGAQSAGGAAGGIVRARFKNPLFSHRPTRENIPSVPVISCRVLRGSQCSR